MSYKIGFWSVFALVMGNQIGSAAFMLPSILVPYGVLSLGGWCISGLGAISLAFVFGKLCEWFPKTGGPHVYTIAAFGKSVGFFVGWVYWISCWICTTAIIVTCIGYLTPYFSNSTPVIKLSLELSLLILITLLNLRGVKAVGHIELVLTLIKVIPLIILPFSSLFFFSKDNFVVITSTQHTTVQILHTTALITFWGFIGLESATTPAEIVENAPKTIPRAIITGTICVAFIYLFNSIAIMGIVPKKDLIISQAPYADAAHIIFGGNWYFIMSFLALITCACTINACILSCGQISLGLSQDGFISKLFTKKNQYEAPFYGLLVSFLGITILLISTSQENLLHQMNLIINFSVFSFLFIYSICSMAFLKLLMRQQKKFFCWFLYGITAFLFCGWIIYHTIINP